MLNIYSVAISAQTIESVRAHINIEEVLADFITFSPRRGSQKNLWACCPFHHEKTPSFAVSPDRGFYKCFGCDAKGDLFTFLKLHQGMEYLDSIRYLAKKYGIEVIEENHENEGVRRRTEGEKLVLQHATEYYCTQLASDIGKKGIAYLKSRGISDEVAHRFAIGLSPKGWRGWYEYAIGKHYSKEMQIAVGLVIEKEGKVYDRFRGRLMFPLHRITGAVAGFGARLLEKNDDQPKYLNSPETAHYQKSRLLYGLYQAKNGIRKAGRCYLVEGYTDVLALHEAGLTHVVASAGTSFTKEQAIYLKRFTQEVILLFDGDDAGSRAALRAADILLPLGFVVKIVSFPLGEDPHSYWQQLGSEPFTTYLKQKEVDFIIFLSQRVAQHNPIEDPQRHQEALKEVLKKIYQVEDPIQQAVYLEVCSRLTKIDQKVLQRGLERLQESTLKREEKRLYENELGSIKTKNLSISHERELLLLLLRYGHLPLTQSTEENVASYMTHELSDVKLQTPLYLELYEKLLERWKEDEEFKGSTFVQQLPEGEIRSLGIDLLTSRYTLSECWGDRHGQYVPAEDEKLSIRSHRVVLYVKLYIVRQLLKEHAESWIYTPNEVEGKLDVYHALWKMARTLMNELGISFLFSYIDLTTPILEKVKK